jgi:hypothetical protein
LAAAFLSTASIGGQIMLIKLYATCCFTLRLRWVGERHSAVMKGGGEEGGHFRLRSSTISLLLAPVFRNGAWWEANEKTHKATDAKVESQAWRHGHGQRAIIPPIPDLDHVVSASACSSLFIRSSPCLQHNRENRVLSCSSKL